MIGVGGFLGVGEKNVGIPYNELKFSDKDGTRVAVIEASKDNLSSAPNYVWTENSSAKKPADATQTPVTNPINQIKGAAPSRSRALFILRI